MVYLSNESKKKNSAQFALIIPTLREADNLPKVLAQTREALDTIEVPYEILVVDDDSGDGTEEIVSAIAREDSRVRLCVRKNHRGLSGAILYGWRQTSAPILGVMDADLQHPPALLPHLLRSILDGHDLVIGSRYTNGGTVRSWKPARKLLSVAAIWLAQSLHKRGQRIADPTSGFFLVRRECVQGDAFQQSGFKLLLEILVRGNVRSVVEVPICFGTRNRGQSKAGPQVAAAYLALLSRLYTVRMVDFVRSLRPTQFLQQARARSDNSLPL